MDRTLKISWIAGIIAIVSHITFVATILMVAAYMMSYIDISIMEFYESILIVSFLISRVAFIISTTSLVIHKKQRIWLGIALGLFGQIGLTITMLIPRRYI